MNVGKAPLLRVALHLIPSSDHQTVHHVHWVIWNSFQDEPENGLKSECFPTMQCLTSRPSCPGGREGRYFCISAPELVCLRYPDLNNMGTSGWPYFSHIFTWLSSMSNSQRCESFGFELWTSKLYVSLFYFLSSFVFTWNSFWHNLESSWNILAIFIKTNSQGWIDCSIVLFSLFIMKWQCDGNFFSPIFNILKLTKLFLITCIKIRELIAIKVRWGQVVVMGQQG